MKKEKIAISIDNSLLSLIDSQIDNTTILSRSQAIEYLIKKSLKQQPLDTAIILIHKDHQNHLIKKFRNIPLIQHHLNFLIKNKIRIIYIITQKTDFIEDLIKQFPKKLNTIITDEKEPRGTASALSLLKNQLKTNFIVINGDTFNDFNLQKMFNEHLNSNKLVTMGLISSQTPHQRGSVILDGNTVINFKEKQITKSNIINAGIYIIKPEIFNFYSKKTKSLEKDLFPLLALKNQIQGFFTFGDFVHIPEN